MTSVISNRDLEMLRAATAISMTSCYPRVHIGCVIADKNKVYGIGVNRKKTHSVQDSYNKLARVTRPAANLHAEIAALIACGHLEKSDELSRCTAYIGRLNANMTNGLCRPCPACMLALQDYHIERLIYTTPDGIAVEILNGKQSV